MALKKSSKQLFEVTKDLKFIDDVQEVQEVQAFVRSNIDTHQVQEVQEVQKEIGTTQGKKGQKLRRINMAFSDVNHEYITKESRRRGISATAFVNSIIDEYRQVN